MTDTPNTVPMPMVRVDATIQDMHSAVAKMPPSTPEHPWTSMAKDSAKYLPFVSRVIGVYLAKGVLSEEVDVLNSDLKAAIPELENLTEYEIGFVHNCACEVFFDCDVHNTLIWMADDWISDPRLRRLEASWPE
ncbi:hypothetical protein [Rhizobium sp. RAF56]|uniref:hypothetical protein n=1 Tax=Rhizobium sp. RAF56 TaxID=3233062 RepID=UPI003F9991FA